MTRYALATLCALLLAVSAGVAQDQAPPPCDNEEQPWMCGGTEYVCTRTGEGDGVNTPPCKCQHGCDKDNEKTVWRKWDRSCSARCSTSNCQCRPHPCGET